ncbi:SPOR domain-containing protein [uncultured Bartonella sp.]|uniref:SPOR domain-containing protein n=1 Tax=uncultured Bartonella sp. TaxID=104108 RepID=UPI0025D2C202|nr:SPOR domain-containing protein [uncultured Bartonella sp.]
MTDNNRNAFRPEGQAQQSNDPLLELTRLFNLDFNPNGNNESNRPSNPETSADVTPAPHTNNPDDSDLSFLDTGAPQQNQQTQNAPYAQGDIGSTQQNVNDDLDFLPNADQQQSPSTAGGAGLPFNELYDAPSFTPRARTPENVAGAPNTFSDDQLDMPPDLPIGDEPILPRQGFNQSPSAPQNSTLPEDFNFVPERNAASPSFQNRSEPDPILPTPPQNNYNQISASGSETASAVRQVASEYPQQYAPNTAEQFTSPDSSPRYSPQPTTAPVQEQGTAQQYPAFDEMKFDKELENLLVNAPLESFDNNANPADTGNSFSAYPSSHQAANPVQSNNDQYGYSNQYAAVNNAAINNPEQFGSNVTQNYNPQQMQPPLHSGETMGANNTAPQNVGNTQSPLPYTPPAADVTAADDSFFDNHDPLDDNVYAGDADYANSYTQDSDTQLSDRNQSPSPSVGEQHNIAAFDLEDLSTGENVIVNPPAPQMSSGEPQQESNFAPEQDQYAQSLNRQEPEPSNNQNNDFQPQYVQNQHAQISQPVLEEHGQDDYAYQSSPVSGNDENLQYGNDKNGDLPPDVDTYNFAENVVETTEPVDVPDIPYAEEETAQQGDALENEFADVFSVGNKQESANKAAEQDDFFADAYAQSGYNLKQQQSFEETDSEQANYDNAGSYTSYPTEAPTQPDENLPLESLQNQKRSSSIVRKLTIGGIALFIAVGGGYAASKYFLPNHGDGQSTVIHADEAPYKIQAEQTSNNHDTSNNQDVYNHANGADDASKENQDKLVDHSETPEDITALNNVPDSVDSFSDPSNVEDAITAASDQTVPTREVQSVVVNPDGTISPSSSADNAEKNGNNSVTENSHAEAVDGATKSPNAVNSTSSKTNSQSNTETSTTDSELAKIINDDAKSNEKNKNTASANANNSENESDIFNSVKTPQTKKQAQPVQTADLSEEPAATPKPVAPAKSANVTPMASVGSGGYYVQIASQPTRESAVTSLNNAKSSFGALIGSLPLSIEPASIPGKGTYYRVRVQVGPRENAISICDRIRSQKGNCFVGK